METQAENVKAKQILEEEALKEKAAQLRAKEQNDQQNLVDLTLAQGKELNNRIPIGIVQSKISIRKTLIIDDFLKTFNELKKKLIYYRKKC